MKQKALILALAATLASPAAMSEIKTTLYGKVHVAVESQEVNVKINEDDTTWAKESRLAVESHASRFGIKGSIGLNDSLAAIYKLEWQVDVTDDGKTGNLSSRNQYGGLKGNFGTAIIGRHDTPLKMSQGKYDLFNDTFGDIKTLMSGELRADNVVAYGLPGSLGDFGGWIAWVPTEDASDDSTWSLMGNYKSKYVYGAIAYDDYAAGDSLLRITGVVPIGNFGIGAMYNSGDPVDGGTQNAWSANAYWKIGNGKVKLQYTDSDGQTVGKAAKVSEGGKQTSIGYNHKLGKRSYVYADYHTLDINNALKNDLDVFALGFVTKF
ncbi:MAG: porin [Pseudomonadota bacterium]|nr:porin [Pseudomonadota bacterium]